MINIHREDLYRYKESKEVTKSRLTEMNELGMEEVGVAQFGIEGIMSGLYIEMVWNFTDVKWKDYMDWVKELVNKKQSSIN